MFPALPLDAIRELCTRYQVDELALFGSSVRRNGELGSDVDLLVTFAPGAKIGFEFVRLQRELEHLLGRRVDLVPKDTLKPLIQRQVLEEAVIVYEAGTAIPG